MFRSKLVLDKHIHECRHAEAHEAGEEYHRIDNQDIYPGERGIFGEFKEEEADEKEESGRGRDEAKLAEVFFRRIDSSLLLEIFMHLVRDIEDQRECPEDREDAYQKEKPFALDEISDKDQETVYEARKLQRPIVNRTLMHDFED